MDVNQIRELIQIVELSGVAEVVVEEAGSKVIVRKGGPAGVEVPQSAPAPAAGAEPVTPEPPSAAGERPATWKTVVAPMVGTFYRSPSPGAAPFVNVGDEVAEGQALCILEAMKLMNEIAAEEALVVREVPLPDASPVEYGTVLFYYEPL